MHGGQGRCSRPCTVCLPPGSKLPVCLWLQAFVTVRKGNKKLAVYDLTLVLSWVGQWEGDDTEVFTPAQECISEGREILTAVLSDELGKNSAVTETKACLYEV